MTAQEWLGGATPRPRSGVVAERSYPASEVTGSWEDTPHIRGQGGGREELHSVQGQWWLGVDTPRPRSGATRRSHLVPEARVVTLRSHPKPEARDSSWEEPPTQEARAGSREEQPKEW